MNDIEIVMGPLGAAFVKAGKAVATARIVRNTWVLSIPGHVWPVTPDMPTARFNKIPGDKITSISSKAFPSRDAALAEVVHVVGSAENGL